MNNVMRFFPSRKYVYVFSLFYLAGCAAGELIYYSAPSLFPGGSIESRDARTSGTWISRHPDPDRVVLDAPGIQQFNARQIENNLINDLADFPQVYSGEILRSTLDGYWRDFSAKKYYLADGNRAKQVFFDPLHQRLNLDSISAGDVAVRYGIIVHYANQKFLPTDDILTVKRLDVDFDELQNNALDVGTPVVVLQTSQDGLWMYTVSEFSEGWVRAASVGLCAREEWLTFSQNAPAMVVISPKADLFLDSALREFYDYALMGTRFPLGDEVNEMSVEISLPTRAPDGNLELKPGYLNRIDAALEPLPYTPRAIITQAYKLLNAPYGWGGMYGEQDCSRFLQEVFATVGIKLPRNSSAQSKAGQLIAEFSGQIAPEEKLMRFDSAAAGALLAYMPGHIILYLGNEDARPFAIHAVWAYREPVGQEDRIRILNRVVVSSLDLGEGSKKGSLLKRLTRLVAVQ
jgi:hypothetical protein